MSTLRLFFATDVHGSDVCWKKFITAASFYNVHVLVLGGDMTGKAIVPIVQESGGRYRVELMDQVTILRSEEEVITMEKTISNKGYYPVRLDPEQMAELQEHPQWIGELFARCVLERITTWMEYADAKLEGSGVQCYVCPGNDDILEVDDVIQRARTVSLAEGRVIEIADGLWMISSGWSNRTPWRTHRELDEEDLERKIDDMAMQVPDVRACIFNLHCPAYGSGLDEAPELDENMRPKYAGHVLSPCGSTAVRTVIERYQPVLALFGHIHEGRGIRHIGKTLCINPGSSYEQGILLGARIDFNGSRIASHTLTSG
jgi:Icc-related predicted phosphoesterase